MKKIPNPEIRQVEAHSEYGPSGSGRWLNCPASIQMIRELPKRKESSNFYAKEGTAAHELSAYCLDNLVKASTQIGNVFNKMEVDKEMAKQTQKYIDYVQGQETWDSQMFVEAKVSLEHLQNDMFGTLDACVVSDTYLEMIDLKYGRGVVVEAKENTQLMLYACGMLKHLESCDITYADDFKVKLTIVQPRAPHKEGPVRSDEVTIKELKVFENKTKMAICDSESENPSFGPGDKQCMWCEAKAICKSYANYNLDVAKLEFEEFMQPARQLKDALPTNTKLTDEELAKILTHAKAMQTWLNSVVDFAISQMSSGQKIPGYKLVYGRSNRQFNDQKIVEQILLDNNIKPDRLFSAPKFKSPAQMEKELNEEEFNLIADKIIKPRGKITLAPDSDGRASIDPNQEALEDWSEQ